VDIGLNSPADRQQLEQILTAIKSMADLCDKLPDNPAFLDRPNSDLKRLIDALPEPQVDPRLTIMKGLAVARGTLGLVRDIFVDENPAIVPSVLPVLLRSALLGAGRVLYMLGPQDEHERIENTMVVLQQEADSYRRAYTQFAEFKQFHALVPPPDLVALYENRRVGLTGSGKPPGEARTLDSMAEVLGNMLASANTAVPQQELDDFATTTKEHARWIFHIYSGIAHGFAWPWLVPGTRSLPGHFIAEFTTTANIAHLAADTTLRRAGII